MFVASALMEWRAQDMGDNTSKVVRNIFEKGLELFLSEPGYVEAYSQWLVGIGDEASARSLFERALERPDPRQALALWGLYLDFESGRGDLAACLEVESRMLEALRQLDSEADLVRTRLGSLLRRHQLLGAVPCHRLEEAAVEQALAAGPAVDEEASHPPWLDSLGPFSPPSSPPRASCVDIAAGGAGGAAEVQTARAARGEGSGERAGGSRPGQG